MNKNRVKKLLLVICMLFVAMLACGCSPKIKINVNKDGSGTYSYTAGLMKGYVENSGYMKFNNIEEVAKYIESKLDPSLNLKVSVDTTSSTEEDLITVGFDFTSGEDLDTRLHKIQRVQAIMPLGYTQEELYGGYVEEDASSRHKMEAVAEYFTEQGIVASIEDRNLRKFYKVIGEYLVKDGGLFAKDKAESLVKDTKDINYHAQILTDGDTVLNIDYMGLNCLEMYISRIVKVNREEIFDLENIKLKSTDSKKVREKEAIKKALTDYNVAGKIKNAIVMSEGKTQQTYSIESVTPVLVLELFDEEALKELRKLYSNSIIESEKEKKNDINGGGLSLEELDDIYTARDRQFEITNGDNKVVFGADEIFDMYNEDNYVSIGSIVDSSAKEHNNVQEVGLDDTPWAGDSSMVFIIVILAIVGLLLTCGLWVYLKLMRR